MVQIDGQVHLENGVPGSLFSSGPFRAPRPQLTNPFLFQSNLAAGEFTQTVMRARGAQIREGVAERERENYRQAMKHAVEIETFLHGEGTDKNGKKTNKALHGFMKREFEALFARIERWTRVETGEIHSRSITADNVARLHGKDNRSHIVDPTDPASDDPTRVLGRLIWERFDDKGNAVVYQYAAENADNVDRAVASERNRARSANRCLKRIEYGSRVSRLIQPDLSQASGMFDAVFDHDEGHCEVVESDPARPSAEQHRLVRASGSPGRPWAVRPDPFSAHRAGFEVRTYRRCRRVLMFYRIPDPPPVEKGYDGLVRSTGRVGR